MLHGRRVGLHSSGAVATRMQQGETADAVGRAGGLIRILVVQARGHPEAAAARRRVEVAGRVLVHAVLAAVAQPEAVGGIAGVLHVPLDLTGAAVLRARRAAANERRRFDAARRTAVAGNPVAVVASLGRLARTVAALGRIAGIADPVAVAVLLQHVGHLGAVVDRVRHFVQIAVRRGGGGEILPAGRSRRAVGGGGAGAVLAMAAARGAERTGVAVAALGARRAEILDAAGEAIVHEDVRTGDGRVGGQIARLALECQQPAVGRQ